MQRTAAVLPAVGKQRPLQAGTLMNPHIPVHDQGYLNAVTNVTGSF